MKKVKYPNLNDYDLSAYEELKGDILYRINGGEYIANTNDAVANGHVGDILVRDDGTEVVINQGDITYAREHGGRVNDTGSSGGNSNSGGSGSNTNNNSNNTGSTSTGNGSNTTTTTTGGSTTNSGSNSAGRANANAGGNATGTGSQTAVNPSRPSGVPGGITGNTVTGKPIAGCVIEHTDDNQNIIKVSWNDKMALKEAEDKFLAYTNGGFDCRLEVYTANGSARVFNTYSDFVKDKTIQQKPVDYSSIGFIRNSETFNQNKTEKELFLEVKQDFNSPDASITHVQTGVIHASSELKNSPNHIAGGVTFDLMEAEYDMMVRKEEFGFKVSAGANVASLSGEIGAQGDDWKIAVGGSVGVGVSGSFEFGWFEKRRVSADLTALLGISVVFDLPDNFLRFE